MTPMRRRVLFAVAAAIIASGAASAVLLGVDVYLHGRYEQSAGFNVWGYRGRSVGKKKPGEFRVAVLGGSSAYGYGVGAADAIPAVLERLLRSRSQSPLFTVVNLAYNNEGAYSFKTTLQDYRWLDYDLAVLYEGYNDLADEERTNVQVFRHDSPLFRITGYMPIFPIIFKEKAAAMLNGGDPGALYRPGPATVFHAGLATRAGAGVLDATANVAKSLEAQIGRVASEPVHRVDNSVASGCRDPWGSYCQSIAAAVEFARADGRQVIVGTQPYLAVSRAVHDAHVGQQGELRAMLARRFSTDPDVRYVDFGDRLNLEDPRVSFDHMHLTVAGNQEIASGLVDPVIALAARKRTKTS
jgi:hypothetical protein